MQGWGLVVHLPDELAQGLECEIVGLDHRLVDDRGHLASRQGIPLLLVLIVLCTALVAVGAAL